MIPEFWQLALLVFAILAYGSLAFALAVWVVLEIRATVRPWHGRHRR